VIWELSEKSPEEKEKIDAAATPYEPPTPSSSGNTHKAQTIEKTYRSIDAAPSPGSALLLCLTGNQHHSPEVGRRGSASLVTPVSLVTPYSTLEFLLDVD